MIVTKKTKGVLYIYKIVVGIGGTNIRLAVINNELNIVDYKTIATPNNTRILITNEIYLIIGTFIKKYQLKNPHIGTSSVGVIDSTRGEIAYTGPTIQNFDGANFLNVFKELSSNITVYNDVDTALLGELSLRNYEENNIFCLTLGAGIGGTSYNKSIGIYQGTRHRANEIGYLLYRSPDDKTFEQRASTPALKDLVLLHHFKHDTNVPKLFELAEEDDTVTINILEEWSHSAAGGIARLQIIYDPELILIGGGISSQKDTLLKYTKPKTHYYLPPHYGIACLQTAQSGNNAALYGAVQ